jgi:hypothetical protein
VVFESRIAATGKNAHPTAAVGWAFLPDRMAFLPDRIVEQSV